MHRLLERQLKKLHLDDAAPPDPAAWSRLLAQISQSYADSDQDRMLLERSLSISTAEMQDLYEQLRQASEQRVAQQESLDRRGRQVRTSTEIAQDIAGAPALPELYQRVVTLVKERFGYYHTQIFRHDPARNVMVLVTGYGPVGEQMRAAGHNLPYGRGVVGAAAATGEPVLAADVTQDPHWVPHPALPATRGELAVPITLRDEVLGVLDVQSNTANALTEEDLLLLQGLAGQIAVAIESTRLAQESRRREQQARVLYEAGQLVNTLGESLAEGLQDFFTHLSTVGNFDRWWVTQLEPDGQAMVGLAGRWEDVPDADMRRRVVLAKEPRNPAVLAIQNRETIIINDPLRDERLADLPDHIRRAAGKYITTPIMLGEQVMGAFSIGRPATAEDIGPANQELARTLTSQVAQAMQNARLFEQTQNALAQVQQSQQFLATTLNSIPNPVFVKDEHGIYIMCNQAFLDYVGTTAEQIVGKSVHDLYTDREVADKYHEMDQALLRNPGTQVYESTVKYADGTLHDVIFNKATFSKPDGTLGGLIGTIVDITERKRAELETQEALRETERLYQMVSREGWQSFRQQAGPIQYQFARSQIEPAPDLWYPQFQQAAEQRALARPTDQSPAAVAPLLVRGGEIVGVLGIDQDPQHPLGPQGLELLQAAAAQVSQALERARLFQQTQDVNLLLEARLQELDVLNDMGRHIDQAPAIPEFLQWAAERIPTAMQYPDECRVAIALGDDVYGAAEAIDLPCQIVQDLRVGDETVGHVYVAYTQERQFPDGVSALLGDMVRRISGYIENRRLLDRLQTSLTEISTLYRMGQTISASEDLAADLPTLSSHLRGLLPIDALTLASYTPGEPEYTIFAIGAETEKGHFAQQRIQLPVKGTGPGWVITHGQPWLEADIRLEKPFAEDEQLISEGLVSRLLLPLQVGGQVVGTLNMGSVETNAFSKANLPILGQIADQMAMAMERGRLLAETRAALAQTESLYAASRAITAAHDRQEIVDALIAHVDRTGLDRVVVALVIGAIEGSPLVEVQGVWDRAGPEGQQPGNQFTLDLIPMMANFGPQDTIIVNDFATFPEVDEVTRFTFHQYLGVQSAAILPISTAQRVLGWLLLETTAAPREFTEEDIRPYLTLAGQAAVALEGQQLLAETERRARREQLLREITAKVWASPDLESVLRTTAQELSQALGTSHAAVRLGLPSS